MAGWQDQRRQGLAGSRVTVARNLQVTMLTRHWVKCAQRRRFAMMGLTLFLFGVLPAAVSIYAVVVSARDLRRGGTMIASEVLGGPNGTPPVGG